MSDQYHYISDTPDVIKATLQSSYKKHVRAYFSGFYVDGWNNISGEFTLVLDDEPHVYHQESLKKDGYIKIAHNRFEAKGEIKGIRYGSNGVVPSHASYDLNQQYTMSIYEEKSKVKGVLLTPLTLTADGIVNIGIVLFASLASVIYLVVDKANP